MEKRYKILLHSRAYQNAASYLQELQTGATSPGSYLQAQLQGKEIPRLSVEAFLECLLRTKRPQIFAESAVYGNGQDWNKRELKLLGAIGIAVPVEVYDDGRHHTPVPHAEPFAAHLLFAAGALLRNGRRQIPVDWDVVGEDGEIDQEGYYQLYLYRLLPLLLHADAVVGAAGRLSLPSRGWAAANSQESSWGLWARGLNRPCCAC
nr:hypothetical protein [Methylomarinum sp. Ch1-1]MDP4519182.1 hypothetical protein [Methylomarinum sp. Ch1-1]